MFDFFIFLVQFLIHNHLHLMTKRKASKQFLGHIHFTLPLMEESSAVWKKVLISHEIKHTSFTITRRCCENSFLPFTIHVPCSNWVSPITLFTCFRRYPFNATEFQNPKHVGGVYRPTCTYPVHNGHCLYSTMHTFSIKTALPVQVYDLPQLMCWSDRNVSNQNFPFSREMS